MEKVVLFVLLSTISCSNTNCNWKGGEIVDFGEYCNEDFKITVYREDNYLRYEVRNNTDMVIIRQDMNISIHQHWGFFLDSKKNFWVFSSDVGDCIWEKDSATDNYSKRVFYHKLSKEEVPKEIFESKLRRFLY